MILTRRAVVASILASQLPVFPAPASAQEAPGPDTAGNLETSPIEDGRADFAQAWTVEEGAVVLVAAPPDIPRSSVETLGNIVVKSAAEIDQEFLKRTNRTFIDWFNTEVADRRAWKGKRIYGRSVKDNFESFWNRYLRGTPRTLMEFLAYMSVFINECDGNLVSQTEKFGNSGHPGISYLFDKFKLGGSDKMSYNQNRSCFDLFNDPNFLAAHGDLPLADRLANTSDRVWEGTTFPKESFPVTGDQSSNGFLLQADFFKYRGRGLIQTTWRSNYSMLVEVISNYDGASAVVQAYKEKWKGLDSDLVCTISRTSDWDRIFADPEKAVLCEGIRTHARASRYLPLSTDTADLNGKGHGSIQYMGHRIGGGPNYGPRLKERVGQICSALLS